MDTRETGAREAGRMLEIAQQLIRTNTCQPDGNEKALVDYIESLFKPFEAKIKKMRYNHSPQRSSLIIKLEAANKTGGIAFAAHLDTVAIGDVGAWERDPFSGLIEDGCLYGRGSVDMKSGATAMIELGLHLLESDIPLENPIYLCFTADEENGGIGIKALVEGGELANVSGVIIAEPTNNKLAIAEKGVLWLRFNVEGQLAHGSKPEEGCNALECAIALSAALHKGFAARSRVDDLLGRATMSLTRLNGGIMTNVIPAQATMEFDIRTLPGMNHSDLIDMAEKIIQQIQHENPKVRISMEELNNRSAVNTAFDHPFIRRMQEHAAKNDLDTSLCGMTYFTDAASLIPAIKKPFLIVGPGNEAKAHQLNESLKVDDIKKTFALYLTIAVNECGIKAS